MLPLESRSFTPKINEEVWVCPHLLIEELSLKLGDQSSETFEELMNDKYKECHIKFINSLLTQKQKMPVLIERSHNKKYTLYNGHHRLAVALKHGLNLKVLIVRGDAISEWDRSESDEEFNSDGHRIY